ncbi:hypothetical protein QE435_004197 [Rhizobium sp. SORGH_AS 787]|nr:hypothetical protein [Rhizobium sp. SORGH_AS_0787]
MQPGQDVEFWRGFVSGAFFNHKPDPMVQPRDTMDDFSNIINLLESAKQLASMNSMPVLAYLIDVAKCEARENKPVLRKRKRGESTAKQESEA